MYLYTCITLIYNIQKMVSLQPKYKNGNKCWYVMKSGRVNGKPRVVWQRYIGTAEKILELKEQSGALPYIKLKSFSYGKIAALLAINEELGFTDIVNKHTDKKKIDGLTVGEYMLLIIMGRCSGVRSKNAMQKWFDKSIMDYLWKFPHKLSCQNFLNHMARINQKFLFDWDNIPGKDNKQLMESLKIDLKIDWVKKPEIKKSEDNKIITVIEGTDTIELKLNKEKNNVTVSIGDENVHVYTVKKEVNKFNIYGSVMRRIEDDVCVFLIEAGLMPLMFLIDQSNWFTYAENFKKMQELLQRGHNKKHRNDKNQVGVGLAVSEENIPFLHETYAGNIHDAKIFPKIIDTLVWRLTKLKVDTEELIVVIDKGNNSKDNIHKVLSKMHILGSVNLDQLKDLLNIPVSKYKYLYTNSKGNKIYGYRITNRSLFGSEFTLVMVYNKSTHNRQKQTYERGKAKTLEGLKDMKRRLESNRGKGRDKASVEREIGDIVLKDLRPVIKYEVGDIPNGKKKPTLKYWICEEEEQNRYDKFGKTAVLTDLKHWQSTRIAKPYNSKYLVEDDFKLMNDVLIVSIGPINHYTDDMIRVHVFLCVMGMLFYRYLSWKVRKLKFKNSIKQLIKELEDIRVAFVKDKEHAKKAHIIIEEMTPKQARLFSVLDLGKFIKT